MTRALIVALVAAIVVALGGAARADDKLVVGTVPIEPFVIKHDDGSYGGISMDLWKEVARKLDLRYEVKELTIADMKDPAKLAGLDVFVSFNATPERDAQFDLTHAFYSTGLAIAVAPKASEPSMVSLIFTARFGRLIAALLAVLAGTGVLIWAIERRRNEQFGGSAIKGIGAGMWWSAVTMTTVGYGDKAPVTLLGRLFALIWMFAAIIVIATFTAQIASALTVSSLESDISGPKDLPRVHVATVGGSFAAKNLATRHIPATAYKTVDDAVVALGKGDVDAVVYEAPILKYAITNHPETGVTMLDGTFDNHGYVLALRQNSALRSRVNHAILEYIATDDWAAVLQRYLGP